MLLGPRNVIMDPGVVSDSSLLAGCFLLPFFSLLKSDVTREATYLSSFLRAMDGKYVFLSVCFLEVEGSVSPQDLWSPVGGTSLMGLQQGFLP